MLIQPESLREMVRAFGIEASSIQEIPTVTRCSTYKIETPGGSYGCKAYPPEYTRKEMESEIEFIQALAEKGVRIPEYLKNEEGDFFKQLPDQTKLTVFEWILGEFLERYNKQQIKNVIENIVQLHTATSEKPVQRPDEWLWEDMESCLKRVDIPYTLSAEFSRITGLGRPWKKEGSLPACHNDLMPSNIIWYHDESFFIDFTNVINAPVEWELATFYSGLILAGMTEPTKENLDFIQKSYQESGGQILDKDSLSRYVRIALVQRSIFLAMGAEDDGAKKLWNNAEYGLNSLG